MNVPTQTEEAFTVEDEKTGRKAGAVKIIVLLAFLVAAGVAAKQLWGYFDSYESTDDAQIEGHLNGISSRISGTVTAVNFENNQKIAAGEVLVELDPRDYQVSLETEKASMGP